MILSLNAYDKPGKKKKKKKGERSPLVIPCKILLENNFHSFYQTTVSVEIAQVRVNDVQRILIDREHDSKLPNVDLSFCDVKSQSVRVKTLEVDEFLLECEERKGRFRFVE